MSLEIASPEPSGDPSSTDDDLTARARVRNAAIARFADNGVAATRLKDIAADVGVSPQLIIHHFGSKDGLRTECDRYVASAIREHKIAAMKQGLGLDVFAALRTLDDEPPLMRYLAHTLSDGTEHVATLIDEMVDDAVDYLREGVGSGVVRPSDDPRGRAAVLVIWQLGALVLHEHIERLVGADLLAGAEGMRAWALPAAQILAQGVITEDMYERWREALLAMTSDS